MIRVPTRVAGAFLLGMTLLLSSALHPPEALAHGGGTPQITRGAAGEYLVYVWSEPESLASGGTLHVTIGVTLEGEDGSETPVTDATVQVHFAGPGAAVATEVTAQPGAEAGGFFYEADATLAAAGDWSVTVIVDGAQGSGQFPFTVAVTPASTMMPWLGALTLIALVIGIILNAIGRRRARSNGVRPPGSQLESVRSLAGARGGEQRTSPPPTGLGAVCSMTISL